MQLLIRRSLHHHLPQSEHQDDLLGPEKGLTNQFRSLGQFDVPDSQFVATIRHPDLQTVQIANHIDL